MFRAHTDPEAIPQWWGQQGSTTNVDKMDVRPGGVWRYIQREADATEYAFNGEYREITPPERLVITFEFEPMAGHVVLDTATFKDIGGKTRVTVTALFANVEDRDGMLESGMEAGANEKLGPPRRVPRLSRCPGALVVRKALQYHSVRRVNSSGHCNT